MGRSLLILAAFTLTCGIHALPQASLTPTWWAFVEPKKPPVPKIQNRKSKIENPIDAFLLRKLHGKGIDFAPPADRRTLIRRAYFDLIGLPPTPDEYRSYLSNSSYGTYENLVDKLLASPRYGERWGRHWLDVVRFGETDGGEHNYERFNAWPYRDYVIDAFNNDLPYHQFIREQIAGDLLYPDQKDKIAATGFLVAGPWDQVSADLNQDPVMRKTARMDELDDFVTTVSATFLGLTVNCARCHDHKFDPIPARDYYRMTAAFSGAGFGERSVATAEEQSAYDAAAIPLRAARAPIEAELTAMEEAVSAPLLETKYRAFDLSRRSEKQRIPLNPIFNRNAFMPVTARLFRFVILGTASGKPRIERLELNGSPAIRDWTAAESASPAKPATVDISLAEPAAVSEITWRSDSARGRRDGMTAIYRFEFSEDGKEWKTLCSSTDHISKLELDLPHLSESELSGALTPEQRIRRAELQKKNAALEEQIQRIPPVRKLYAVRFREPEKAYLLERGSVQKPLEEVAPGALSCLSSIAFDAASIQNPKSKIQNPRVFLADWIANSRNPLTARVIVNRVWHHHFGAGIVNTPSDFGRMGDRPSHPELLDWLAVSFMENGWSIKWLQRQILTSSAYRQSSRFNPAAHSVDAGNRLLWRMPLKRMDAETLRDSILSVTGSLDLKAGGPSFILQKKGDRGSYIYKALDNDGPEVWRRSVYRFVVRGGERIMTDSFDCPDPSVATPQRQVSNTAVQALTLMNNAFVIRQSKLFAARLERERPRNPQAQIILAYLLAFGRNPTDIQAARALQVIDRQSLTVLCRALLNANEFIYVP